MQRKLPALPATERAHGRRYGRASHGASSQANGLWAAQVAGLDVGWGQQLDLEREPGSGRWVLRRELPPGRFPFKFIVDGRWTCSADHPTFMVPRRSQAPAQPFSHSPKACKSRPELALARPAFPAQGTSTAPRTTRRAQPQAGGGGSRTRCASCIRDISEGRGITCALPFGCDSDVMGGVPGQDGETLNNYVEVAGESCDPGAVAARARLLSEDAPLTGAERARLEQRFGVRR